MATISSHILDAERGDHAAGIGISCYRLWEDGSKEMIFSVQADAQGRISESVEIGESGENLEVVIDSGAYLDGHHGEIRSDFQRLMDEIVVRVHIDDPKKACHIPVILSSHSHTVWWSR